MGRVLENDLREAICYLFETAGLTLNSATIVTDCLMEAELAGISTHGISMVPVHVKKCKEGYNLSAELEIEKGTDSFTVCNANNAIGMLSAWKCIKLAVDKSEKSGIHMVFCNHANTFSAAYCYAKYAVEHGKIAFVSCNAPAQMAPLGGKEKLLGTNPIAIGIPAGKEAPFILDMATSAVAKSKINQALHNGVERIPLDWATDINGIPTDDPKEAVKGLVLPMAGPKGYGLSMAMDIVSGLLSHAAFLDNVGRFYSDDNKCMNVGHSFIVIEPKLVYGNNFYEQMDLYLERVRNSEAVEGGEVLIPGDINLRKRREQMQSGIELPNHVFFELNELLEKCGHSKLREV